LRNIGATAPSPAGSTGEIHCPALLQEELSTTMPL
jgi:hypothetical protein